MQRFTFKLDSLKTLREHAEEQAKEALARDLALRASAEERLAEAAAQVDRAQSSAALSDGAVATGHELLARQAYVEASEKARHAARADLDTRERLVGESREGLERASRELEVVERLHERKLSAHRRAVERAEESMRDEIALGARARRSLRSAP